MRHVSRNHRVALDWLFDRINLDPKTQIKYVDTQNQLADLLTKESFTHDTWSNLLRLINIMIFSMFSRSHFRSVEKANTMSKRLQERKTGQEPAVAKQRPTCFVSRNLLSVKQTSSLGSGASNVPGNPRLDSNCVQDRDQNPATNSQERQQDIPCQGNSWKLQCDVCERSGSSWKQVQGVANHLEKTRLHFHNFHI